MNLPFLPLRLTLFRFVTALLAPPAFFVGLHYSVHSPFVQRSPSISSPLRPHNPLLGSQGYVLRLLTSSGV